MARSRIKGTNGKPRKKTKNREQLKASMEFHTKRWRDNNTSRTTTTVKNDNKPTITHYQVDVDKNGKKIGRKSTVRGVPAAANPIKSAPKGKGATKRKVSKDNGDAKNVEDSVRTLKRYHKHSTGRWQKLK